MNANMDAASDPGAEDTFILLDALETDAVALRHSKPRTVLEIGCADEAPMCP